MIFNQPAQQLGDLPAKPGVYRFTDKNGVLLYVGKAKDLSHRVRAYFEGREHGPHIKRMVPHIHQLEVLITATELDALLVEQRLISQLKPKYNIIFRDDKTYAYVALTKHKFPQIKTFRGKRSTQQDLFGPYVDSRSARARIELVQKTFKIRTCDDGTFSNRSRPCVLHQIGRCSGPCVPGLVEDAQYHDQAQKAHNYLAGRDAALINLMSNEMDAASQDMLFEKAAMLRDQIRLLSSAQTIQNLEGKSNSNLDAIAHVSGARSTAVHLYEIREGIIQNVYAYDLPQALDPRDTYEALLSQHYLERHPPQRLLCSNPQDLPPEALDFLLARWGSVPVVAGPASSAEHGWLDMALDNARQTISASDKPEEIRAAQQQKLIELFPGLSAVNLARIECFDISHFQGEGAVASCVVYENYAMRHDKYRIFNISQEHAGDDFASMKEAIIRRYQSALTEELPQLIIIDGGLGQMSKAEEALQLIGLNIPLLGIAKGTTRKLGNEELICSWSDETKRLDKSHPALLLLSHIRDESHRFAITRNRKKIAKKRTESQLLEVPGIGPRKRKALLLAFGSMAQIKEASEDQLAAVPGVGPVLAHQLKTHLALDR